jgi:Tetracyclin repressor-like, C-terminal domain
VEAKITHGKEVNTRSIDTKPRPWALQRAGFSPDDGLRAYSLLTTFTLGQVSYQIKGWARGVDAAAAVSDGRIDRATYPAVVRSITREDWDFDKSFEFGLSIILAGLAARAGRR